MSQPPPQIPGRPQHTPQPCAQGFQQTQHGPAVPFDQVEAMLAVRQEQGAAIESSLVESMASQIEGIVARRYEAERMERARRDSKGDGRALQLGLAIVSLVMAIPLTAISADSAGLIGLTLTWVGIVAVNIAMAMRRPNRD